MITGKLWKRPGRQSHAVVADGEQVSWSCSSVSGGGDHPHKCEDFRICGAKIDEIF